MASGKPLSSKRLLIVEDEYLVAMELAMAVEELGGEVAALAGRLSDAMEAAGQQIDGALVDVQLGSEKSFPLVEKLAAAQIPLILMTGYDPSVLPEDIRRHPRLAKPFVPAELERMARQVFLR